MGQQSSGRQLTPMPHNLLELSGEVCVEEPVENWVAAGAGHAHHVGDAVRQHHVLYNIPCCRESIQFPIQFCHDRSPLHQFSERYIATEQLILPGGGRTSRTESFLIYPLTVMQSLFDGI